MTSNRLARMSVEELVRTFHDVAVKQGRALWDDNNPLYNRLYDRMEEVRAELCSREGDQRHALLPFLADPNTHVRLKAAISVLKIAPVSARKTLQAIVDANDYPYATNARGMLMALDEGRYVPE